ncbi:phosphotransferase [Plantactinospora sp. KLBMP9567]|uniref:phosphotransferase n=1 Tax=Plantactinospora sp. KLBMP9567 TaxID=3085900 RepID=UPI002980D86E|nr:phosphotransferase [Plantactinospora sp. KLBMP9567]MDW5323361.1 phosphotransferase [Plantactinospora sp. KLBMP9567]
MVEHARLGMGRDADVFALDEGRVLRRYRDGHDVTGEAETMRYVAERGFPVPRVDRALGADLVMERIDGPTLREAMAGGDLDPRAGAEILADLHRRLRDVPARPGSGPGTRVVHLDLHPENVMLGRRGPVVIDWRNARDDQPDLDVAMTALILAEVVVGDLFGLGRLADSVLTAFVGRAPGDPVRLLESALAMRRGDPNLSPEEKGRLDTAVALVRHDNTGSRRSG